MVSLVENKRGINSGKWWPVTLKHPRKPLDTDDDVAKTMNLLFQPKGEELAYPVISFDTTGVSDKSPWYSSWPIVITGTSSIPGPRRMLFANEAYWYFNTAVYPEYYTSQTRTQDIDLRKEVEKQDVIFLMITERFVHKFDWTFIDNLYKLYAPGFLQDPVYDNINRIMMHAPWYADVIEKGRKNGITLEEALILDGRYLYNMDDTAGFMIRFGPDYYQRMIRNDQTWMASIREKAKMENLPDEEMLEEGCALHFPAELPGLFRDQPGDYSVCRSDHGRYGAT